MSALCSPVLVCFVGESAIELDGVFAADEVESCMEEVAMLSGVS